MSSTRLDTVRRAPDKRTTTPTDCVGLYIAALELCGGKMTKRRALDTFVMEKGCEDGVRAFRKHYSVMDGSLEGRATHYLTLLNDAEDVRPVFVWDDVYPPLLRRIPAPPAFVFMRGNSGILRRRCVAVVGTRKASEEGLQLASQISSGLAHAGLTVVSGLALGIDETAHRATLRVKGKTAAVIGTPLDKTYPAVHKGLQREIGERGIVVSQFPIGVPVKRFNFPERNRVMSGLCEATVVIEAGDTSGAVIQARQCLSQGRTLFMTRSVFDNPSLTWAQTYAARGAMVVNTTSEIIRALNEQ